MLRRARGYAPAAIRLDHDVPEVLAAGAELKNTFCLTDGSLAYMSGHIGDMGTLETLRAFGAVSEETATAMVRGVLRTCSADLGVSVTGIAGPGGGTDDKPVGTVWIGVGNRAGNVYARRFLFRGDRERVRVMSAYTALRMVQELADGREHG